MDEWQVYDCQWCSPLFSGVGNGGYAGWMSGKCTTANDAALFSVELEMEGMPDG